ncbi:MAG: alpha-2-macroglobulin family protein [Pseudomonadota bacterium]
MRVPLLTGALSALLFALPASAERAMERLPETDIPGFDYRILRNVPLAACEATCIGDSQCAALTYNERAQWCFLKSEAGERTTYRGATSAIIVETAVERLPLPDVSYLPTTFTREADRLQAAIAVVRNTGAANPRIDTATAAALTAGGTTEFISFSRRMLSLQTRNWQARRAAEAAAAGASYLALAKATTPEDQGAALAQISAVLERQNLFRPAMFASEASLVLAFNPTEQARLNTLRQKHGFRVLDYSVNSDVETPRLCVQFSEPLRGDSATLQRFVTLNGAADPTVSVENRQLCVEGLTHGERYEVGVRQGLPATTDERLLSDANFRAYVRDRAPLARFDANDYVLPASAAGVPVTTINTDAVDLALYRVNDRNLADVVRRGEFKRTLWPYELREISNDRGAKVWEGEMAVERRLNREVRTLVPVADMIAAREPGVYLMTAIPEEQANRDQSLATQWFVISDIGLSTFSADGAVDVFTRSLNTATPTAGVELTLLGRNDAILATATTNAEGFARLTGPANGTPAIVTARAGEDYAFLPLTGGAFELTDRGVAGRTTPGPVDAFLATERGVYRGGETVHLTALMRDDHARALSVPVTIRLTRPDGVISRALATRAADAGGLSLDLPLSTNAVTGTWRVSAHIDPKGPAVGTTTFLVEDFVPQRIEVSLTTNQETATAGDIVPLNVAADFLYGAPASGLMIEGAVTLQQVTEIEGFDGYRFGLAGEAMAPARTPLAGLPRTDAIGKATIEAPIPDAPDANGPLQARIALSVREPSGRQVTDRLTLPVLSGDPLIGIRQNFENGRVAEGSTATFQVIGLDATRARTALSAEWTLTRIQNTFQWYRRDGRWFYDAIERRDRVAEGTIALTEAIPATIEAPVRWGRYELEVATDTAATTTKFSAGWVSEGSGADTPDVLEVHLDKERYAAGEIASVRIAPRAAGKALVTVLTSRVETSRLVDVPAEGTTVELPVSGDWARGAYVAVTHFRDGDDAAGRPLPERAVGIAYLDVGTDARRLSVAMDVPAVAPPRGITDVPILVSGLAPGETANLTVAAVDIGILNLTGYEAPDVDGHYLGQRRLGLEMRDLYGDLIDTASATRGQVRSGGDGVSSGTDALPPTEDSVSLFTGVITTDAAGVATAQFDIPAFNGALKVMAVVWTDDKVGDAAAEMTVRDPVVVAGALPRFLAPGDNSRVRIDLHNVAHTPGDYTLTLAAEGPIALEGTTQTLRLGTDERDVASFPLTGLSPGLATLTATLKGPDNLTLTSDYRLTVRPAANPVTERRLIALAPGEGSVLPSPVALGFDADADLTVSLGTGAIDTAGLLTMLNRFPYGCAEQTVSRALPLLYAGNIPGGIDTEKAVTDAIDRVRSFQTNAGGFGLWSPGYDLWLTAYVMDFLTRAREAGHTVPDIAFESGLDRLQSVLSYIGNIEGERGTEIAYASYVLARNGRAAIGDLRYFAEEKLTSFPTALSRAQLAASLALTGDAPLATRLFERVVATTPLNPRNSRIDYGTPLRDAAAIVTLAAESGIPSPTLARLEDALSAIKADTKRGTSTQEAAWLVLAANAAQDAAGSAMIAGERLDAPASRLFKAGEAGDGLPVQNLGEEPIAVAATVTGTPIRPLPPVASGLTLKRSFHTLEGKEVSPATMDQNTRLVVRLEIGKTDPAPMRLMLTDLLPAGFEVENPKLLSSGDVTGVIRPSSGTRPVHTEFRDDRFAAAWTLSSGTPAPIVVSYLVRAVTPGGYTLPAAEVADMYQPRFIARTQGGRVSVRPVR